jgi:hypothetical protein
MKSNRYAGKCHACGRTVKAQEGQLKRKAGGHRRGWVLWCMDCYVASDNSSYEDQACGNRAYEDQCAAACGLNY